MEIKITKPNAKYIAKFIRLNIRDLIEIDILW